MRIENLGVRRLAAIDAKVLGAFAAIYLVWGSTFLAIRYALESIPPFMLVGLRCVGAGALLFAWVRIRGEANPPWREWRSAAVAGFFYFVLCHGSVAWAEQHVPSGLAAVVMALIPIWVILLDWLRPGGARPNRVVLLGVALGFAGLVVLIGPGVVSNGIMSGGLVTGVLALAALAWAGGTVYNRYVHGTASPGAMSAMQLLAGGAALLLAGAVRGEAAELAAHALPMQALVSLGYLIVFGSLLTFSAYTWLLRVRPAEQVATYAYVNPLVAVALGWAFAGEQVTAITLVATALIVGAVTLIVTYRART